MIDDTMAYIFSKRALVLPVKHAIAKLAALELGSDMAGQESGIQQAELLEVRTARFWSEVLVAILETARMRIIGPN